jgi:hypothetical protein
MLIMLVLVAPEAIAEVIPYFPFKKLEKRPDMGCWWAMWACFEKERMLQEPTRTDTATVNI